MQVAKEPQWYRSEVSSKRKPKERAIKGQVDPALREKHRSIWLSAQIQYRGQGRTQLQKILRNTYYWLLRNDRAWFEANSPERVEKASRISADYWKELDGRISAAVAELAASFLDSEDRLKRITRGMLATELRRRKVINRRIDLTDLLNHLPCTAEILDRIIETPKDFAIRKIILAVKWYAKEKRIPSRDQLMHKAAIGAHRHDPDVQRALDEGIEMLLGNSDIFR